MQHSWLTIDDTIEEVLHEYEARQAEENLVMSDLSAHDLGHRRDDFLLSVGRATGILLNILIKESRAQSILEIGTAFGYSTLWLASAARETGGKVVTLEVALNKQQYARRALERSGLIDCVDFCHADALDFLAHTDHSFDFVLIDLWKDLYIPCINLLLPRLRSGATVVADNMLEPAIARLAAARYQAHVRTIPDLPTVLLSVGSGLAVSRYRASK